MKKKNNQNLFLCYSVAMTQIMISDKQQWDSFAATKSNLWLSSSYLFDGSIWRKQKPENVDMIKNKKAETTIWAPNNSGGADESLFHRKDQWALACRLKNAVIVLTSVSQPCQSHLLCHRSVALQCCLRMQRTHYSHTSGGFSKRCFIFVIFFYNNTDIVSLFPTPPSLSSQTGEKWNLAPSLWS